jgi:cobalamin biosynthetic protein CobC
MGTFMSDDNRDHGGNIDAAVLQHGGDITEWVDLSTGINRRPYPLPVLSAAAWTDLPTKTRQAELIQSARHAYNTEAPNCSYGGAQSIIQSLPGLQSPASAKILAPTYNEFRASFHRIGWRFTEVSAVEELKQANIAIIVNPNNPTGRIFTAGELLAIAETVDMLV